MRELEEEDASILKNLGFMILILNEQVKENKCNFKISRLTTNIFIYYFYLFI